MNDSVYVLILVVLGLFVATLTARSANNREATQSGGVANIFNFLASGLIAMIAPVALCSIFFIHPNFLGQVRLFGINMTTFAHVVLIVLLMVGAAIVLLIPYAMLEKPHLNRIAQQEDKGWTREDAETSGL
ncbi:MAG: hypothetical protein AAFV93_06985 [Chloroflexota bacterium]